MGSKKIKIQLEDADGGKYDLALQGNISKTKIIKFIEVLDLLEIEGKDPNFENNTKFRDKDDFTSLGSKIWNLVEQKFPYTAFTSSDILELYEDEYQKPIKLSAIATYLSRYSERGKLSKTKKGKEWLYEVVKKQPTAEQWLEETYKLPSRPAHDFSN
ncbi:MAG: hypothetical protein M3044_17305 [Thermoproteota archaeon]|nr:hypothetical protein [Thermoproteota archaeon]